MHNTAGGFLVSRVHNNTDVTRAFRQRLAQHAGDGRDFTCFCLQHIENFQKLLRRAGVQCRSESSWSHFWTKCCCIFFNNKYTILQSCCDSRPRSGGAKFLLSPHWDFHQHLTRRMESGQTDQQNTHTQTHTHKQTHTLTHTHFLNHLSEQVSSLATFILEWIQT